MGFALASCADLWPANRLDYATQKGKGDGGGDGKGMGGVKGKGEGAALVCGKVGRDIFG